MIRRYTTMHWAALALIAASAAHAAPPKDFARPRLVVLISIDQFRGDYLTRFPQLFLPAKGSEGVGGFRYLMDRGAYYPNAQYTHFPLFTGVGHAVLSTGGTGSTEGIIGNSWYEPARGDQPGHEVYCVADPQAALVGGTGPGVSPRNLRSTTVADELKMATDGKAKVCTVSFKDRAAVLLAGRLSDTTIWYNTDTGRWETSRFYRPDGTLPAWVAEENDRKQADAYFGRTWEPLYPEQVANNAWMPAPNAVTPSTTLGKAFPHTFTGGLTTPGRAFYSDLWSSPFATEMVLNTALDGVRALGMGQDDVPDFLGMNFAANDYVGHAFGPNSPEAFDITLHTDRLLASFFRALDRTVPGGLKNVTIALSADHGVAPIPEAMESAGFHAGRVPEAAQNAAADAALDEAFGPEDWVEANVEPCIWLSQAAMARRKADPREVRRIPADAVRRVEGVYDVYTREQFLEGRTPDTVIARKVLTGFHPKVSGDLIVVPENLYVYGGGSGGTTHGTPWSYDTHVPVVLAGFGITPGRYPRAVSPQQIAPTLASLLGVDTPSACTADPLTEALQ